jgi:hypothetical protein
MMLEGLVSKRRDSRYRASIPRLDQGEEPEVAGHEASKRRLLIAGRTTLVMTHPVRRSLSRRAAAAAETFRTCYGRENSPTRGLGG